MRASSIARVLSVAFAVGIIAGAILDRGPAVVVMMVGLIFMTGVWLICQAIERAAGEQTVVNVFIYGVDDAEVR